MVVLERTQMKKQVGDLGVESSIKTDLRQIKCENEDWIQMDQNWYNDFFREHDKQHSENSEAGNFSTDRGRSCNLKLTASMKRSSSFRLMLSIIAIKTSCTNHKTF
jgi:hypothetical protein